MNELSLRVQQNPGSIELNFDELEAALDAKLAEYKGAIFTEDTKTIAKQEVASLRKLKKSMDDVRKGVKNEWMNPFTVFEDRMKGLMKKVDEPISFIEEQVKAFEMAQKEAKRKEIEKVYDDLADDEIREYAPLNAIYNTKWENVSTSMKSIRIDIADVVSTTKAHLAAIRSMGSDVEPEALNIYKRNRDLTAAIGRIHQYEQNKAAILEAERRRQEQEAERKRQAEIERIRAEERAAIAREAAIRKEAEEAAAKKTAEAAALDPIPEAKEETILPFVQPDTKTVFYRIVASDKELEEVEMLFNSLGIYFERRDA